MSKSEMIKWLQNLKKDIGQSQHQDLWHYAEMLDEVIGAIEVSEDAISGEWLLNFFVEFPDDYTLTIGNLRAVINDAPPVVPQQKEGEWIVYPLMDEERVELECPICGDTFIRAVDYKPHFCENCGSKMKGASDETNVERRNYAIFGRFERKN